MRSLPLIILILLFPAGAQCFEYDTGGHFRLYGSSAFYETDHLLRDNGADNPFYDASVNMRLKTTLTLSETVSAEIHYEAGGTGGDTRQAINRIPGTYQSLLYPSPSDDTKMLDLTATTNEDDHTLYHRLDRLYVKYNQGFSSLSVGRQAITTGNGLLFNPMDLLNPFAPAAVVKDYKTGTDMAVFQFSKGLISDGTLIYVPRRNEANSIDIKASSCAFRLKAFLSDLEGGLFYARHFNDDVTGIFLSGFAGAAAWRTDILWTHNETGEDYLSSVINLDYSWVLANKNWYGFIEFYYSGIGEKDLTSAITKPSLLERLNRGDLFNTATTYMGASLQYEYHPLVNLYLTAIVNLDDTSSLLQPGAKWSAAEALDILLGADLPFGGSNTEFQGIDLPGTRQSTGPPQKVYLQGTYYF